MMTQSRYPNKCANEMNNNKEIETDEGETTRENNSKKNPFVLQNERWCSFKIKCSITYFMLCGFLSSCIPLSRATARVYRFACYWFDAIRIHRRREVPEQNK